jgi:hypothetical protein
MWMILQIAVCVTFLLIAAFWTGKKIGQRRFYKIQEEMKALELYYKHLMEDMEMVSNHNMKVLETSTAELKELLAIADKKCLYANDLLKEIDDGNESLKRRNLGTTPVTSIDSGADKKFRREVQEALEELLKKLIKLSDRVTDLELESPRQLPSPQELGELVCDEISRQLRVARAESGFERSVVHHDSEKAAEKVPDKNADRIVPLKAARENFVAGHAAVEKMVMTSAARMPNVAEFKAASIEEKIRTPVPVKKTDLEKTVPVPPAGSPVNEVLRLYSQGVTLPQIARTLNMGKGEIELILKLYGQNINMRKIM